MCSPVVPEKDSITSNKDSDCAAEGYYYISQGYRKIPGNNCVGGVNLDPIKKPCTRIGWVTSFLNIKAIAFAVFIIGALYYGWPIIEAIILVLPIPDPKSSIEMVKQMATNATGVVSASMK